MIFFGPRRFRTDVRAEDYRGYTSPGPFLSSTEAGELNKHLVHLTTERVGVENYPKKWEVYDFIRRAHDAAIIFLRFLLSPEGADYRPNDLDLESRIRTCERIEGDMRRFLNQPKA